jgi:anti-sigma B factor antagonist
VTSLIIDKRLVDAGSVCLAVAGEVDMDTHGQLEAAIRSSLREGNLTRLVVDLEKVTFLDSQGIAVLMTGYSVAARDGIAFRVGNPHDIVRRALEITGLLGLLTEP